MTSVETIRSLALELPEASEEDHFGAPSFRVRGKIFATLRPGRLTVKLASEDQHNLCQANPEAISPVPGYWGRKGSTFVDPDRIDDGLAETLLRLAWSGVAPKSLSRPG
ncbi:MAG: MmcQ/YjbR family DNA-binding protein [Caulobacteraceae bacterium]